MSEEKRSGIIIVTVEPPPVETPKKTVEELMLDELKAIRAALETSQK